MKAILVVAEKGNEAVGLLARYQSSGCSNAASTSMRSLSQTPAQRHLSQSSRARYDPTVSSIRIASGPKTSSMPQTSIMSASTIPDCLPKTEIISTGSRTYGTKLNGICDATMASQSVISISISRSANGASITGLPQPC